MPRPPTFTSHTGKAIRPSLMLIAISTDRTPASIEADREADFEPWAGPTEPNSGVNHEFEQVPVGVAHVDARTCFPTATLPRNRT
jgi:hypothetical protein